MLINHALCTDWVIISYYSKENKITYIFSPYCVTHKCIFNKLYVIGKNVWDLNFWYTHFYFVFFSPNTLLDNIIPHQFTLLGLVHTLRMIAIIIINFKLIRSPAGVFSLMIMRIVNVTSLMQWGRSAHAYTLILIWPQYYHKRIQYQVFVAGDIICWVGFDRWRGY